jgi:hypothetical protein
MRRYRFEFHDDGCMVHSSALNMHDDQAAMDLAKRLAKDHDIEVWSGDQRVGTIARESVPLQAAAYRVG